MEYDRDITFDPVGEPKDMFSREVGKTMWQMVPFDKCTWKKVSPAIQDTVLQHLAAVIYLNIFYMVNYNCFLLG
jgi:hypothetical protein